MIPQEKSAAVTRGLQEAFGVSAYDDISELTKGNTTSRVFRIVAAGSPYLLKIIMRTDDPTRHYGCMKAAAEAGLAPRIRYTNIEDKVSITDFVESEEFPMEDALVRMPAVLRALHALPPFPGAPHHLNTTCMFLVHKGPAVDGFIQKFQSAKVLPEAETAEVLARYQQVAAGYPIHDEDMVSSHNDLFKPDNILFDGSRVWLVDWEAAFLNDRYADLAVVACMVAANEGEERVFLEEYFGQPPDEYRLARFFLAKQAAHLFYAMAFFLIGASGRQLTLSDRAPDIKNFQQRFWNGEIDLKDSERKIAFARVHWELLSEGMQEARFEEAVKIVSDRYAGARSA